MSVTGLVVIGIIVFTIIMDVVLAKRGHETESSWLRNTAWRFSSLPFTAGFVLGHWFFPRAIYDVSGWMLVIPCWGVLLLWDLYWHNHHQNERSWYRYPGWYALIGIPAGALLWGQSGPGGL